MSPRLDTKGGEGEQGDTEECASSCRSKARHRFCHELGGATSEHEARPDRHERRIVRHRPARASAVVPFSHIRENQLGRPVECEPAVFRL